MHSIRRSIIIQTLHIKPNFIQWNTIQGPVHPHHHMIKGGFSVLGSYLLAFTNGVSHKRPLNLLWGYTTINSCYLWKEGYIFVWQHCETSVNDLGIFTSGQRIKISLKCRVTIPVKLTCSLCTKSLGRNVGQKLIMWSGKWGLYQDISQGLPQICLHMLAQEMYHVIGYAIMCLGMGYSHTFTSWT